MLDMLQRAFKKHYILSQEISVDENTIGYKGRARGRTYNKSKHIRWGFRDIELTESSTGYLWDFWLWQAEDVEFYFFVLL